MSAAASDSELRYSLTVWKGIAGRTAKLNPRYRVGTLVGENAQVVPFPPPSGRRQRFVFGAVNVPAFGNCLYHAVWLSAQRQGIERPFGLRAAAHVYTLRVMVAERVVRLIREGVITDVDDDWRTVGSLVAHPDQYLRYSGNVPLVAMAAMLGRTISTICADGVSCISPTNFEAAFGQVDLLPPIVIYHCNAANPSANVAFGSRNHYCAITYEAPNDLVIQDIINKTRSGSMTQALNVQVLASHRLAVAEQARGDSTSRDIQQDASRKRPLESQESVDRQVAKAARTASNLAPPPNAPTLRTTSATRDDQDLLACLSARALDMQDITVDELRVLAAAQNFTSSPRLALLFFHCCSNDPRAYVFNDEKLLGANAHDTTTRLLGVLETPIDAAGVSRAQEQAETTASSRTDIYACASCCEVLTTPDRNYVCVDVSRLHGAFRLDATEISSYNAVPELVRTDHLQVLRLGENLYHLNPDLVPDPERIILCTPCYQSPRDVKYSLASGHDYGRIASLPELNDVAVTCVSPLRCFGVEIALSAKHSKGHAICFPSDGPVKCARVLPSLAPETIPHVTFLGSREQWRISKNMFKHLYEVPTETVYTWLRVLQHAHTGFKDNGIIIEESEERAAELLSLTDLIEQDMVFDESTADVNTDPFTDEPEASGDSPADAELSLTHAAVLKPISEELGQSNSTIVIDTLLDLVGAEEDTTDKSAGRGADRRAKCVIPILRDDDPFVEWSDNGRMIACAFPHLFLRGGHNLPTGSWPTALIAHLMRYYDGRFERNTKFIALLFNQLQRHTAVKRAAKVGITNTDTLQRFGSLVNSAAFRDRLIHAKNHPNSPTTKRLNASLLRVLSLVGSTVPFSPFERASSRPKIAALRYRYGVPQHWVTIAPPEHDDLILQRIAMIRKMNNWNSAGNAFSLRKCKFADFPEGFADSARTRLSVSNQYPALAAGVFQRCVKTVFEAVVACKDNSSIRVSRHFGERLSGPYGKVAAQCYVVEPQRDGRLHAHALLYGSTYTPELLSRIACSRELRAHTARWLESVSCTTLQRSVHDWRADVLLQDGRLPRAYEIDLPDAARDLPLFFRQAEKRVATTNVHVHSSTCFKTARGKYMCRLARPAGIHEGQTCPLVVTREKIGNLQKGKRPGLSSHVVDRNVCAALDRAYNYKAKKVFRNPLPGPLVWELHRPPADKFIVETNRTLAALSQSHTNSSIINGEDAGDVVEQYQQNYMTKEGQSLQGSIPILLSAFDHVNKYPSRAEDRDTAIRMGKYAATRTVNAFSGAHEWAHSVMVHAISGFRSFTSSDSFWYIFPHQLVSHLLHVTVPSECARARVTGSEQNHSGRANPDDGSENEATSTIDSELDELVAIVNNDSHHIDSKSVSGRGGGTRAYKTANTVVFVSQVESYIHRGVHFEDYSPLEFECIVDILPVHTTPESNFGRIRRKGFPLGENHPLRGFYLAFIRTKPHTPIFGGAPPPIWKVANAASRRSASRYLLATFTNWCGNQTAFTFDEGGFLKLCADWDSITAPLILRQRYRYIRNVLKRGHRNARNEQIASDWRNRNVDIWKELNTEAAASTPANPMRPPRDLEKDGLFDGSVDMFALTKSIVCGTSRKRTDIRALRLRFESIFDPALGNVGEQDDNIDISLDLEGHAQGLFVDHHSNGTLLRDVASRVVLLTQPPNIDEDAADHASGRSGVAAPVTDLRHSWTNLSPQQQDIWARILPDNNSAEQTLTLIHGGGGTGKSHVVRAITCEIVRRGFEVVNTCTTGAGACQLVKGYTFHSAFKVRQNRLPVHSLEQMKQLFTPRVRLVVVDEVSMLSPHLLVKMDERLREIYNQNLVFGGISVLLVGDFLQLQVVKGKSLCAIMYEVPSAAQNLFMQFKVYFLTQQQRASGCPLQQSFLDRIRALPTDYPSQQKWPASDAYQPISGQLLMHLTRQLTPADIVQDNLWWEKSVILVTSNVDRATLNACMTRILAKKRGLLVFRWRKRLSTADDNLLRLKDLLYDEDERPTLFGYFFYGAAGQVLDNSNGNVSMGVANGTPCLFHSIAWDDPGNTATVLELIERGLHRRSTCIDLPFPPDFINVKLLDRDRNPVPRRAWSSSDNLATEMDGDSVIVPIGIVKSTNEKFFVKIPESVHHPEISVYYEQHAVDLAMALTVWKAQGGTFDRVLLHLEGTASSPPWAFEHVYVALSRVRAAAHLRSLPLSLAFNRAKFLKCRPNIYTVKWRMDVDAQGRWAPRQASTPRHAEP